MNKPNKKYDHVQCSLQKTHCMAGLKIIQKRIKVQIDWFNKESGNTRQLISTCHYRPTIIFCDSHQERHWSFILDFYSSPEFGVPTIAEGTFLAETLSYAEETWNKMRKGTHFL